MAESEHHEQFVCSICLDTLKEPVTIPCGHSYCLMCINDCWGQKEQRPPYRCPQCRESFTQRPLLKKNTLLSEMMEKLEKTSLHTASCSQENSCVECDVCTTEKNRAVMSCLQCLASFCECHLQPHYQSPVFMKHKLVKATTQVQENVCVHHGKLMEIYCQDDNQCICYLCMIDCHKGHSVVSVESEWTKKKKALQKTKVTCTKMIHGRERGQRELGEVVKTFKISAQEAAEECKKIFTELICSLEKKCSEINDLIGAQEKAETDRAEDLHRQLDQELTELRQKKTEIENLLMTENQVNFLKGFQSVCTLPTREDIPGITQSPHVSFEGVSISGFKEALEEICQKETDKISHEVSQVHIAEPPEPKTRKDFLQYFCQLQVDPNTAYQSLILSDWNRRISCTVKVQQYPCHPERFDSFCYIMCREALCGRCYWEVECSGKNWAVGVCYKGIERKGISDGGRLGFNNKSWRFGFYQEQFGFIHDKVRTPLTAASRIGVYLDHKAGTLSYYNITKTMTPMFRFQTSFTEALYPVFQILSDSSVRIIERERVQKENS
ncbi:E3 ubiquitin/ISG15 ligase TRIM25-like [Triplophysa rosa]|uniref:E3 ubiquitin/ISG15 ligase TRIM25-like n=1 Tax=Triplophysa rosa TaxID=992332 RepID=A0A9W7TPE4_TRIRA|nr:E3 ubiquitin/ISG15 ligase TRIM25-like [Triplophysa rosa]KAI7800396.1 putative E3 ubiquitin/ISG15 ligase TRIM25-like [Triplophysa rosa]